MLRKFFPIIVTAFLLLPNKQLLAQDLLKTLPQTEEEFKNSEPAVIATIDWLEKTPFVKEEAKRKEQMKLLMAWVTNSPSVTVELNADILTFTKKYPELLITFFGGWVKYCLQNKYSTDALKGNYAGIKSVTAVYQNLALKKDKEIEKLISLEKKGELEDWIQNKLKKN